MGWHFHLGSPNFTDESSKGRWGLSLKAYSFRGDVLGRKLLHAFYEYPSASSGAISRTAFYVAAFGLGVLEKAPQMLIAAGDRRG